MQNQISEAEASRRAAIEVAHDRLDPFAISILTLLCIFLGGGQVAMKIANAGISPVLQGEVFARCWPRPSSASSARCAAFRCA